MKARLQALVDKQIELYRSEPDRMVSDYNGERQNVNDYNGRQILELIQNADDEKATDIFIKLDTSSKALLIANSGKPFSEAGYKSLMLSNLSSKTKERFIGNKGLGFRSIINWSESITVRSNALDATFSGSITRQLFENSFDNETKKSIRESRGFAGNAIPWAILATPEVIASNSSSWATEIIISYRNEFLDNIVEQISSLKREVLLFLNHLKSIVIDIDGSIREIVAIKDNDYVTIENARWRVFNSGVVDLPAEYQDKDKNERQHYNIKLALPDIIKSEKNTLFSFFPTKIELDFPFILHGTFDLDSSRNQLNDTAKNRFVLSEMIELIVEVAKELSADKVGWEPLKMLSFSSRNPVLESLGFYSKIEEYRNKLPLYPCIDGTYRTIEDARFKSNEFSRLIIDTEGVEWFGDVVKPLDDEISDYQWNIERDIEDITLKINSYSEHLLKHPIKYRVDLIYELHSWSDDEKYSVLLNDQGGVANVQQDEVFTPLTSSIRDLELPDFVSIDFIHDELYKLLLKRFSISSEQKARELQRKLKEITNIHSYEPGDLIRKIVSSTNTLLKSKHEEHERYIKGMVASLYSIFLRLGESTPFPKVAKLQLLSKEEGYLATASDLYLSSDYVTGLYVSRSIGDIYTNTQLLAERKTFGLEKNDETSVEKFFTWLGVNEFVKYEKVEVDNNYIRYIHKKVGKPASYRSSSLYDVTGIDRSSLRSIPLYCSLEQIVYWLYKDQKARASIFLNVGTDVRFSCAGESLSHHYHSYQSPPSYIVFQLASLKLFDDYLMTDDRTSLLVNEIEFDYTFFENLEVPKSEIESILVKLGAKSNFEDLSFKRINQILRKLPDIDTSGKNTQKIYKLALEYYKNNKGSSIDEDILLFARTDYDSGFFEQSEVYYTDNVRLPTKLIEHSPIFNFPKRSGANQVSQFFNVRNLNNINVGVVRFTPKLELVELFEEKFRQLKPYLLSYRLDGMQKNKNAEARLLTATKILICDQVLCSNEGKEFYLDDNDYVKFDGQFLIKVNSTKTLNTMIKDSSFGDTFSEIISSVFRINDHRNDIRTVLRDDISDTEHLIIKELGYEVLLEARELLGISDYFVSFWKAILDALNLKYDYEISKNNISKISETISLAEGDIAHLPYDDLEGIDVGCFIEVLSKLGVSVSEYNSNSYYKFNLTEMHASSLKSILHKNNSKFERLLYEILCSKKDEERKKFLSLVGMYEHSDDWVEKQASKYSEVIHIDYIELVNEFVKGQFSISLENSEKLANLELDMIFNKNISILSIADSGDLPINIRSLLYFDDSIDKVRQYLKNIPETDGAKTGVASNVVLSDIPDRASTPKAKPCLNQSNPAKRPGKHSSNKDKVNKENGLSAEIQVFEALVHKYGSEYVRHVSIRDDTFGYDLKYSPDSGESWKYVEVKRCTQEMFHLSRNEKRFSENNKSDYELFLVSPSGEIKILENVDFEDEEKFTLIIKDYEVHFTCE